MSDALKKGRCSQLIYENVKNAKVAKTEREKRRAEYRALMAAGKARQRDAFGRMIKPGAAPLPPRERDSRGFFIKRQKPE
jgi:hypothetical protein